MTHRVLVAALLALSTSASAQWLSWPPKADTPAAERPAETQPIRNSDTEVRLLLERHDGVLDAWISNPLAGPVEAEVRDDSGRMPAVQLVVPARSRARALQVTGGAAVAVSLKAIPGQPNPPVRPTHYLLPVPVEGLRIDQADGGRSSHANPENFHAIDFAAPLGTPVTAARAGTVMQIDDGHPDAPLGVTPARGSRANFVRVLHDDGTMALYAHLQQGSIVVMPGQPVGVGTVLGRVGNSGDSTAPHLHFTAQVNQGMKLQSIPVRIDTPQGELKLPK